MATWVRADINDKAYSTYDTNSNTGDPEAATGVQVTITDPTNTAVVYSGGSITTISTGRYSYGSQVLNLVGLWKFVWASDHGSDIQYYDVRTK